MGKETTTTSVKPLRKMLKYKKRKENYMYEQEVFAMLCKYYYHDFGVFYLNFNDKVLATDSPTRLYTLLKNAIKNVQKRK